MQEAENKVCKEELKNGCPGPGSLLCIGVISMCFTFLGALGLFLLGDWTHSLPDGFFQVARMDFPRALWVSDLLPSGSQGQGKMKHLPSLATGTQGSQPDQDWQESA